MYACISYKLFSCRIMMVLRGQYLNGLSGQNSLYIYVRMFGKKNGGEEYTKYSL
jgi:hypothetical protein